MMVGVQATDSHFSNKEGLLGSRVLNDGRSPGY